MNLKRQSIRTVCNSLVLNYLGPEGKKPFDAYYAVRSTLLHEGQSKIVTSFVEVAYTLDLLVSRLLLGHIYNQRYKFSVNGENIPGLTKKI